MHEARGLINAIVLTRDHRPRYLIGMKRRILPDALRGAAIGAANTVPGVSGGTIAVITGVYARLITALGGVVSRRWRQHAATLAPIAAGLVVGVAAFAHLVEWALSNAPEPTALFFVGLILGSLPVVTHHIVGARPRAIDLLLFATTLGLLVYMGLASPNAFAPPILAVTRQNWWLLSAVGAVAAATMIVPGISGSFVLVLLGRYSTLIFAISDFNVPVLALIAAGAFVGLIGVVRAVEVLLRRFHRATYWAILGLVVGSVVGIWPRSLSAAPWAAIGAGLAGLALALLVGGRRGRAA